MQTTKFDFNQKEIYTLQEACIYMGISKSTMYKLTSQSRAITFFKPSGKLIYFRKKDLDDFMLRNINLSIEKQMEDKFNQIKKA